MTKKALCIAKLGEKVVYFSKFKNKNKYFLRAAVKIKSS